jgi:hypothetical protein
MESVMIGGGFSIFGIDLFGSSRQFPADRQEETAVVSQREAPDVEQRDADRVSDPDQQDIFLWSTYFAS